MSRLSDIIRSIFESDKAVTDSAGQRTVTMEAILPEVEGLQLFDEVGSTEESETEGTNTTIDLSNYATVEQLSTLIDRLVAVENLMRAVDTVENTGMEGVTEEW